MAFRCHLRGSGGVIAECLSEDSVDASDGTGEGFVAFRCHLRGSGGVIAECLSEDSVDASDGTGETLGNGDGD